MFETRKKKQKKRIKNYLAKQNKTYNLQIWFVQRIHDAIGMD